MLDIKRIRIEPDGVKAALQKRDPHAAAAIDDLLAMDAERRRRLTEIETLKAEQNRFGPQIAALKKTGGDASELLAQSTQIKTTIAGLEGGLRALDDAQAAIVGKLPNLPQDDVQAGGEADAVEIAPASRTPRAFDFTAKAHWEICETHVLVDFERGVKLSGSGFVIYRGMGAKLQRALIAFMLDTHTEKHGYIEVGLPYALTRESVTASGHIVKFAPEMYHDAESDLFFLPTAEPALVNIHRGEILPPGSLPLKYVAHTPCWRREAGAAGKDTRGLQRVHQFDKVEIFRYVLPEHSDAALFEMTAEACAILEALDIPFRLLRLAGGDMSFAAAKTIDVEAWSPGMGKWLEVSSASNCTDFQSRRADTRFRRDAQSKPEFPHLLNASGLALPRVVAALLETHQNADGTVTVPAPLRPYLGGRDIIG